MTGFDPELRDGQLTLVGECAIETQVISLGQMPALSIESSGSSEIALSFTTLTDDETTLVLSDIIGNRYAAESFLVRPGTHTYNLETINLSAGLYQVSMLHGRHIRSLSILIIR